MTLPVSPNTITAEDINVELGRSATDPFDINGVDERALAGVASGAISFSDFHGKSAAPVVTTYLAEFSITAGDRPESSYYGYVDSSSLGSLTGDNTFTHGGVVYTVGNVTTISDFPNPAVTRQLEVVVFSPPGATPPISSDVISAIDVGGKIYTVAGASSVFAGSYSSVNARSFKWDVGDGEYEELDQFVVGSTYTVKIEN